MAGRQGMGLPGGLGQCLGRGRGSRERRQPSQWFRVAKALGALAIRDPAGCGALLVLLEVPSRLFTPDSGSRPGVGPHLVGLDPDNLVLVNGIAH